MSTGLPRLYKFLKNIGLQAGAFGQLTTEYAENEFNKKTPDDPNVKYFSYGSFFQPNYFSAFRAPWKIIHRIEGPNDGLVSVKSAIWGEFKGSISNANHLDVSADYVQPYFIVLIGVSDHQLQQSHRVHDHVWVLATRADIQRRLSKFLSKQVK